MYVPDSGIYYEWEIIGRASSKEAEMSVWALGTGLRIRNLPTLRRGNVERPVRT